MSIASNGEKQDASEPIRINREFDQNEINESDFHL
jgi:hypothetical protein